MPETVDIALGRRKRSIARVRFIKGKGNILINDREVSEYFKRPSLVMELKEPLSIVEFDNKNDILVNVKGGGLRRDLTAGLQPKAKDSEGEFVLTGNEQIFGTIGSDFTSSNSGGSGFVPGRGFPELQGYELFCNIRQNGGGSWSPGTTRRSSSSSPNS